MCRCESIYQDKLFANFSSVTRHFNTTNYKQQFMFKDRSRICEECYLAYIYACMYFYLYIYIFHMASEASLALFENKLPPCLLVSELLSKNVTIRLLQYSCMCVINFWYQRNFISLSNFACELRNEQSLIRKPVATIQFVNEWEQDFLSNWDKKSVSSKWNKYVTT